MSQFSRIWRKRRPGLAPVLTGQGTHQPVWSANADKGRDPSLPARHDPKVVFMGGFQQVYVPFVPVQLVSNYV